MNGRKDNTNWNTATPIRLWFGVVVTENDALLELNLESNNLDGNYSTCFTGN
jgi:hypothetical protein